MDVLNKVPVREQDAKVRAANFEEDVYKRQVLKPLFPEKQQSALKFPTRKTPW